MSRRRGGTAARRSSATATRSGRGCRAPRLLDRRPVRACCAATRAERRDGGRRHPADRPACGVQPGSGRLVPLPAHCRQQPPARPARRGDALRGAVRPRVASDRRVGLRRRARTSPPARAGGDASRLGLVEVRERSRRSGSRITSARLGGDRAARRGGAAGGSRSPSRRRSSPRCRGARTERRPDVPRRDHRRCASSTIQLASLLSAVLNARVALSAEGARVARRAPPSAAAPPGRCAADKRRRSAERWLTRIPARPADVAWTPAGSGERAEHVARPQQVDHVLVAEAVGAEQLHLAGRRGYRPVAGPSA